MSAAVKSRLIGGGVAAILVVGAALAFAWPHGNGVPPGAVPGAGAAAPGPVTAGPRPAVAPYTIPAEQLAEWVKNASPGERPLIEDGVLSCDEYETAVQTTLRCIEEAGLSIAHSIGYGRLESPQPGPRLSSRGVYSYVVVGGPTYDTAAKAAVSACKSGSAQIEFLWAQHTAPSQVEIQAMRNDMRDCLAVHGALVPEKPTDLQLRAALDGAVVSKTDYRTCQAEAADAFEIDEMPG